MKIRAFEMAFSDFSVLAISSFATMAMQIAATALVTRIVGTSGYGQIALFLLVTQLIFIFGFNWTSAAIIRYGREEYVKTGRINKTFWARNLILFPVTLLFVISAFLFRDHLLTYTGLPAVGIYLVLFYTLSRMFLEYVQYIQQAIEQIKYYSASKIFRILIYIIALTFIMCVSIIPKSVPVVICIDMIAIIFTLLIFLYFFNKEIFLPVEIDFSLLRRIFLFSYPGILGSGSAYIVNYIDIIVIKRYLHIADVGVYSLSYNGFMALKNVVLVLITILNPLIITLYVENREDLIVRFVKRLIKQGVLIWSFFLAVLVFLSKYIIPFIFGKNFYGSIIPFSILSVGLAFSCLNAFYTPIVQAYELVVQATFVNIIIGVINLVGDFILVPHMGINGAAISSSFAFFVGAMLYSFIAYRKLCLKEWDQIFSVMPLLVVVILLLMVRNDLFRIIGIIIIFIISIMVIRRFKVFQLDDLEMFSRVRMPAMIKRMLTAIYIFLASNDETHTA